MITLLSTLQVTKKQIPVPVVGLCGVNFFCFLGDQWLRNALLALGVRGGGVISPQSEIKNLYWG